LKFKWLFFDHSTLKKKIIYCFSSVSQYGM